MTHICGDQTLTADVLSIPLPDDDSECSCDDEHETYDITRIKEAVKCEPASEMPASIDRVVTKDQHSDSHDRYSSDSSESPSIKSRHTLSSVVVRTKHAEDETKSTNQSGNKRVKRPIGDVNEDAKEGHTRNKRMFGILMGTLKRFKTEENDRAEATTKRSMIESKLNEHKSVIDDKPLAYRDDRLENPVKEARDAIIDLAESKLDATGRFKKWESVHKCLTEFIKTDCEPCIFWCPREHTIQTKQLLETTKYHFEDMIAERTTKFENELTEVDPHYIQDQHPRRSSANRASRRDARDALPARYRYPSSESSDSAIRKRRSRERDLRRDYSSDSDSSSSYSSRTRRR